MPGKPGRRGREEAALALQSARCAYSPPSLSLPSIAAFAGGCWCPDARTMSPACYPLLTLLRAPGPLVSDAALSSRDRSQMCKHVMNAQVPQACGAPPTTGFPKLKRPLFGRAFHQVSVRAPCCKKWFDCPLCHEEKVPDHPLVKATEMVSPGSFPPPIPSLAAFLTGAPEPSSLAPNRRSPARSARRHSEKT